MSNSRDGGGNPKWPKRLRGWLWRIDETLSKMDRDPDGDERIPPAGRFDDIVKFVRSVDLPDDGARAYLEKHIPRIGRTLALVPPPQSSGRILEMGAYMQMTPALQCVLGYKEVRGAYYGTLGKVDEKTVTSGGREIFRCLIDHFNAEKDRYPYPDNTFETVLACEIFEHMLFDPMHMLTEMRRVLEEGGTLILTTPNVASCAAVVRALRQDDNPQVYSKFPYPFGDAADTEIPHVREYTPRELRWAVEAAGFEVESLFTEPIEDYKHCLWAKDFLRRQGYPAAFRGEQMYCIARKRSALPVVRYPNFLYEGV